MSALLLTKVLSVGPVLLVGAPEVAVVPILLPTVVAGFDAFVPAAARSWNTPLYAADTFNDPKTKI